MTSPSQPRPAVPPRPSSYDKRVALVLQGGGALGSYQAGVYEVLSRSEYIPDWVAGISIGAINAALIAGNAPEQRVEKLRAFWREVTDQNSPWPLALGASKNETKQQLGVAHALLHGAKGFFKPLAVADWLKAPKPVSFYDTSALKSTLERLVDFDRINARETRFSVGAVNVETAGFSYFDNAEIKIRPEHVMASGALPPGFPAIEIDGKHYWDGGLVSNTPLQQVLDYVPRHSRLTFQVDLFHGRGRLPTDLAEVAEREKDVRFASRTRMTSERFRQMHDVRYNINALWEKLPDNLKNTPEAQFLYAYGCVTTMDIVQLIYRPEEPQGTYKDADFSRSTMESRWQAGIADAETTLAASPWLAPPAPGVGARSFDVIHERHKRKAGKPA